MHPIKVKKGCISFIILSWNSEFYLEKCFQSINNKCNKQGIEYEIWVVDNGSTDKSIEIIKKFKSLFPDSFFDICLPNNKGTTYPRNLALKKARGEIYCVLDSDTEILEGSLKCIIEELYTDDGIGIIAPQLMLPDGMVQPSVKKFPMFYQKILKVFKILFKLPVSDFDFYDEFPFCRNTPVDTAISACWFFKKSILEEVGYLDEKIFYSPEDIDFCVRVWKKGLKVIYFPSLKILHNTQWISHRKPFSKNSFSHLIGLIYFYRKHGGWVKKICTGND